MSKKIKRLFNIFLITTMVLGLMGVSLFNLENAKAVSCPNLSPGDVVKSTNYPALYTVTNDYKLSAWYEGWHGKTNYTANGSSINNYKEGSYPKIKVIDPSCVSKYPQATFPVPLRPGSHPFYRPSTNDLYYPIDYYQVKKITPAAAEKFFGKHNWKTASVFYWPFYSNNIIDGLIDVNSLPPKNMLTAFSGKFYLVNDDKGGLKEITNAGLIANRYNTGYAYTLTKIVENSLSKSLNKIETKDDSLFYFNKKSKIQSSNTSPTSSITQPTQQALDYFYVWGDRGARFLNVKPCGVYEMGCDRPAHKPIKINQKFDKVISDQLALDVNGKIWSWWWKNSTPDRLEQYATIKKTVAVTGSPAELHQLDIGVSNVKDIKKGYEFWVILDDNGQVYVYAESRPIMTLPDGPIAKPTVTAIDKKYFNNEKVKAIAAGLNHILVLTDSGNVWSWGNSDEGKLGDGGSSFRGDVITPVPLKVSSSVKFKDISSKSYMSLALDTSGNVWAWGGQYVACDLAGIPITSSTPMKLTGLNNIKQIETGLSFSLALDTSGNVWAWGNNDYGQVGIDLSSKYICTPTKMYSQGDATMISAGNKHGMLLRQNGTVLTWGNNTDGQLGLDNYTTLLTNNPVMSLGSSVVNNVFKPTTAKLPSNVKFEKIKAGLLTSFAY